MKDLDKIAMWLQEIATEMKKDRLYQMMKDLQSGSITGKCETDKITTESANLDALFESDFFNEYADAVEEMHSNLIQIEYEKFLKRDISKGKKQEQ